MDIELPDGRLLEIEVSGPVDGIPLLFHHGTPGSARPFGQIRRAVHTTGLRLVTYSRPGYGSSTRQPGRDVVDVVPDMAAVLDQLGAVQCLVAGWSGGGPRALATAAANPVARQDLSARPTRVARSSVRRLRRTRRPARRRSAARPR